MNQITASDFEQLVKTADRPILLDFFAVWCGPCKMLAPVLQEVAEQYPDVLFAKVDVDEEPALASRFNISVIPTLVLIRDGKPVASATGYRDAQRLSAFLDGALAGNPT